MKNILDIDMDFFLDHIAHWINGNVRLDSGDYKPWNEQDFRIFLEERCKLSTENPTYGRIITNHHEAFFFWDELINSKELNPPFNVTHIDSHSDTGLGDNGYAYIMGELASFSINERRKNLDIQKVYMGNYLAYAIACGWINEIDFVLHEEWDNDIIKAHLKNFSDAEKKFQIKCYPQDINIGMYYERIIDGTISPLSLDKEVPYSLIPWREYQAKENYDYIIFCQSPGYTPQTADFMIEIIKDYIIEV